MRVQEKVLINQIDFFKDKDNSHLIWRVGSEGCIHKFLAALDQFGELIIQQGNWRIVTPPIPDKYLELTLETLSHYRQLNRPIGLTINDYGLLYRLQELGDLSGWQIWLGRRLVRSLLYVPWKEYLLRREEPMIQQGLFQLNLKDQSKLKLLKKLGVTGLEISAVPGIEEQLPYFLQEKLEIGVHVGSVLATLGRACPILRYYEEEAGCCTSLCDRPLQIQAEKIWQTNGGMYQTKPAHSPLPELHLLENLVLAPVSDNLSWDLTAVTVIQDPRLSQLVSTIQELVPAEGGGY